MRRAVVFAFACLSSCGGGSTTTSDGEDAASDVTVETGGVDDAAEEAAFGDADAGCTTNTAIDALASCLATNGPDDCLSKTTGALCDSDGDGLSDDVEAAIARAYAPAFAFNGGAYGGNAETDWAANAKHFVSHAHVVHRPDGASGTTVDDAPSLDTIAGEKNGSAKANDPAAGQGSDFWLCLNDSTDATRVTSKALMLALPDGVDVVSVVHPANGTRAASTHLFVSYSLLFAYNQHSTVDNHEGDWEGIALFVNLETGAVDAGWFERHDTTDSTKFIDVATYPPRDPSKEKPYGDMDSGFDAVHGLRFWDFGAHRRHVVAYVGTGGHAMYDYPANTHIFKFGPRDTHDGDAAKLLPWASQLVANWGDAAGDALKITFFDAGESSKITLPWARFRGQWGCDDGTIAKSWPGPFGNARHPRPLFDKLWGSPPKG